MGDGARIQSTDFVGGVGLGYAVRPGLSQGAHRLGYQALLAANFNTFVDEYRSFRLVLGGTASREEAIGAGAESLTTVGGAVEAYVPFYAPVGYVGIGLNPRAVISDAGRPPEFELGVTARLSAIYGNFGLALSVAGGLRLGDMARSSVEVGLGAFINLF